MSLIKAIDRFVLSHTQQTGWDTFYLFVRGRKWRHAKRYARRFLGEDISRRQILYHSVRMSYAYIRYGWWFDEYFMYHFNRLSHSGRKEFVPDIQKEYFCDKVNAREIHERFANKGVTYRYFSEYYHRDVCPVECWERDEVAFSAFVAKHDAFIIKPIDGTLGRGVRIIRGESLAELKHLLDEEYPSGFLAEELIKQHEQLATLHPESVNTIRITTLRKGDKVYVAPPFIRMGRGNEVVDNAAQGGIFAAIDRETGIVLQAADEQGNVYIKHPETGVAIVGFKIPEWDKALELAKALSRVVPEWYFAGWDLAYTDKGWVMVEANSRGQFVCFQTSTQIGFRQELEKTLGKSLKAYCKHVKVHQ